MEENGVPAGAGRRVRQIMTTSVVKIQPSTPVSEIARLMVEHQVSGLPVVDPDDRVLGVVTEIDMVARNQRFKLPAFITFLDSIIYLETPGHFRKRLEHMLGASARDIMSEPAVTIAAASKSWRS
jgi:CBS domain-containing protein